jgi:hypothetical protein
MDGADGADGDAAELHGGFPGECLHAGEARSFRERVGPDWHHE